MALHWNTAKLPESMRPGGKGWYITELLIFLTMPVGIPLITLKNWEEFLRRLRVLEATEGPYLKTADGLAELWFQPEQVKARVGLSTNASPITKAAFDKAWAKRCLDRHVGVVMKAALQQREALSEDERTR